MVSARAVAKARDEYTELHEGQPPSRVWTERAPSVPRHVTILGRLTQIQYRKRVTDGTYPYNHPFGEQHAFSEHAQPLIGVDKRGHLWVLEGRYTVTSHGIEDLPWWQMRREKLPPSPRARLTTLGKLEFLRYKREADGVVTEEELRFERNSAPTLAHDERGNLFVLGGQSVDPSIGEENMARRRHSRRNPRHSRRGMHHKIIRTNPSRSVGTAAKEAALMGGATGLMVAVGAMAIPQVTSRIPQLARLSPNMQALATAGIGIALGTLAGAVGAPTVVGVGLSAAGVAAAAQAGYRNFQASRAAAQAPSLPQSGTAQGGFVYGRSGQYAAR